MGKFDWLKLFDTVVPKKDTLKRKDYKLITQPQTWAVVGHTSFPEFPSDRMYSVVQSICTHFSSLSGSPGTLKKSSPEYEREKSRVQKTGSLLFEKSRDLFSF